MREAQGRYEAIYRAVMRRALRGVLVCVFTTVALVAALIAALPLLTDAFSSSPLPDWARYAAIMTPLLIAVAIIPNAAQFLVIRGRTGRAIETVNAATFAELEQWRSATGRNLPRLWNVGRAARWLDRNEGLGTPQRIRVQIWVGRFAEAAESIDRLPINTPYHRFQKALLTELVSFVATGSADLAGARRVMSEIPASEQLDAARCSLAFEEARIACATGGDWIEPLDAARRSVAAIPRGASIRERMVAGARPTLAVYALIGTAAWFVGRWQ